MSQAMRDRVALTLAGLGAVVLGAGAWLLLAPAVADSSPVAVASPDPFGSVVAAGSAAPSAAGELVVDVQGGVVRPGIVMLPAGSRVAEAIEAAGGYAPTADMLAAAGALNLAAPLTDGAQVFVPLAGVAGADPSPGTGGGGGGGGLVNLNSATPEELEALPGIGPVTVQKIVAARTEQPFASLDEMVQREVINRGQLEDIQDLVTL
jgi:competence protein ComEA